MIKISLIVPVYNVASYLPACFESIEKQTVKDFEVILVDDGATDNSGELCDTFAEKHPEYARVIHQENRGLGGARNAAMPTAEGEYIFFLDSDDTITPDAVEKVVAAASKTHADMIVFPVNIIAEDGSLIQIERDSVPSGEVINPRENTSALCCFPVAWNKVAKKSLYTDNQIEFPSRAWYEDIRTTTKLIARAQSVYWLDTPLYNYLRREGSIMNNAKIERNREIIDAFDDIYSYFDENDLTALYREELEALTVEHVLLAASVRVIKSAGKHPLLGELREYTEKKCKNIKGNRYIRQMSKSRKLVLSLLLGGHFATVRLLFKIKH